MRLFSCRPSLRTLLTVPYVLLVLVLAVIIGALSYSAGRDAVNTWSDQLLVETVSRIEQAVDQHVAGSAAVLEAAFPRGVPAPGPVSDDLLALRTRFWLATSVHRDPNNYAYYGDREGRFFGLWRHSEHEGELRLRLQGSGPRSIYRFTGISGTPGNPVVEERIFEPRDRPWFAAGQNNVLHTWTSIYIDFKTSELVATRARRVTNAQGSFEGVVATDLSLRQVNHFLQELALSANGVAMVVENDGKLIGVSRGPNLSIGPGGNNARLNAADSNDAFVASTYRAVAGMITRTQRDAPRTQVFDGPDGKPVQVGYSRLRDDAGLDWIVMVAVPRRDFLHQVEASFRLAIALAALAAVCVALLGLWILNTVTRELRAMAVTARKVGDGDLETPIVSQRTDELGQLARSISDMQARLLTDQLTGLSNRTAVIRRIEERILQHRRRGDSRPFVVLFVDFNRFKQINDAYGHDVGDQVLRELAQRLRQGVRAMDIVARYAGDEFVILLDAVEQRREGDAVRQNLEARLCEPLASLGRLDQPHVSAGAAIGMAVYPDDGLDVDTLIRKADADMYLRKAGSDAAATRGRPGVDQRP